MRGAAGDLAAPPRSPPIATTGAPAIGALARERAAAQAELAAALGAHLEVVHGRSIELCRCVKAQA